MVIKNNNQKTDVKTDMRGGTGKVIFKHIVDKEEMDHCRLFSTITLKKDCSIGTHTHVKETEYYYILSGEGVVTEKDGLSIVKPGDVVITGDGESHSIANANEEDLVFIALIILEN